MRCKITDFTNHFRVNEITIIPSPGTSTQSTHAATTPTVINPGKGQERINDTGILALYGQNITDADGMSTAIIVNCE